MRPVASQLTGLHASDLADDVKPANPHHTAVPVGDVRGYEGSESGVSANIFIADVLHSSNRSPQQTCSWRVTVHFIEPSSPPCIQRLQFGVKCHSASRFFRLTLWRNRWAA
jgi:hypothetical protein